MRLRVIIFGLFVGLGALGYALLILFVAWETRLKVVASMRETMTDLVEVLGGDLESRFEGKQLSREGAVQLVRDEYRRFDGSGDGLAISYLSNEDAEEQMAFGYIVEKSKYGLRGWESKVSKCVAYVDDDALVVGYPLIVEGKRIGYLTVNRSLERPRVIIWNSRWKILGIGSFIGVLALWSSWWLSSRLTHSLERLANYAMASHEGEAPLFKPSKSVEIQQLAKALDSMRKALDGKAYVERYTQSLAHALKAPLAGVRASSEILMGEPEEADKQRFLGHILDESQRMDSIVEKLLRLASLESGTVQMDTKRFDIGELAAERATSFAWAKDARGIDIEVEADSVEVTGDPFWLGEAIAEMLSNAVEFSADGGVARLRVGRESNGVRVTVLDDGQGIPEWAIARVSERFYSLPRNYSGKKGTGLGLAFVREVARLHGGRFSLENRLEGGVKASLEIKA